MVERTETTEIDPEQILAAEGNTIEHSPYTLEPVDLSVLEGSGLTTVERAQLEDLLKIFESFLSSPIISDSFSDHAERRAWEDEARKKYGPSFTEYLSRNRLGGNAISPIKQLPYLIDILLGPHGFSWNRSKELDGLFNRLPRPFTSSLSPSIQAERTQTIREISDVVYDLYRAVVAFVKKS